MSRVQGSTKSFSRVRIVWETGLKLFKVAFLSCSVTEQTHCAGINARFTFWAVVLRLLAIVSSAITAVFCGSSEGRESWGSTSFVTLCAYPLPHRTLLSSFLPSSRGRLRSELGQRHSFYTIPFSLRRLMWLHGANFLENTMKGTSNLFLQINMNEEILLKRNSNLYPWWLTKQYRGDNLKLFGE